MEALLESDIAKLVLGKFFFIATPVPNALFRSPFHSIADYLKKEESDAAYRTFCKNNPYLKEEYQLYKKGCTPVRFLNLRNILFEYFEMRSICKFSLLLAFSFSFLKVMHFIFSG
jgi:hypothetical protein